MFERRDHIKKSLTFVLIILAVVVLASSLKCDREGENKQNQKTGNELESLSKEPDIVEKATEYSEYAEEFVSNLKKDEQSYVTDGMPDLKKVYLEVLHDYAEYAPQPVKDNIDYATAEECANHFRDYWFKEKKEYPKNQDGSIDWFTIYFMVLHHYVTSCVTRKQRTTFVESRISGKSACLQYGTVKPFTTF